MEKLGEEAASKFINALIKSVQTLCHGYLEFHNGVQIIGHINLNVDEGTSLDYILKEKVCKDSDNSTLFISNSFHAEPKAVHEQVHEKTSSFEQTISQNKCSANSTPTDKFVSSKCNVSSVPFMEVTHNVGSSNSSTMQTGSNTLKRKASDDDESSPIKAPHLSLDLCTETPYSHVDSKVGLLGIVPYEPEEIMLPQTAREDSAVFESTGDIGVNFAGSVLEPVDDHNNTDDFTRRDDDSDGDLEVTFIKEEFVEGERSTCSYRNTNNQEFVGSHRMRGEHTD